MKELIILGFTGLATFILYLFYPNKDVTQMINTIAAFAEDTKVVRDPITKKAYLHIQANGKWSVYEGNSVERINMSRPILKGKGSGIFELKVPHLQHSYFMILSDGNSYILAERHLPMEGGHNFRDLGGYITKDGRSVKWGKIFRSDELSTLTDADLKYLSSIPIISIVDFRSTEEIQKAPDKIPASVQVDYAYSITPGNLTAVTDLSSLMSMDMDSLMQNINILLISDTVSINRYRDFFDLLQHENDVPLLFHCTAGKDRTGMGAALVLSALGVDEQTIMEDYLLSNTYLKEKYAGYIQEYPSLEPLFTVRSSYLQAGLNEIKKKYGSIEKYLTEVLKVDIQKFRDMYLY